MRSFTAMFSDSGSRSKVAAYGIVILVCAALGGFLGKAFLVGAGSTGISQIVGTNLKLTDVDWSRSERTFVLAVRPGCSYCKASAEFYRALAERCRAKNVPLVVLSPATDTEGKNYLAELGVSVSEVRQAPLALIGIARTPTLLLVDQRGRVDNAWVGKLSTSDEQAVLARFSDGINQRQPDVP